jgi:hypothetical protein
MDGWYIVVIYLLSAVTMVCLQIFSNCSTMEEADMLQVASFMETIMANFSDLQNESSLAAQSYEELNAMDDDLMVLRQPSPTILNPSPVSATTSRDTICSDNDTIQVARENSREFIQALRSLSNSNVLPNSVISAPRLGSSSNAGNGGIIQVARANSRGTIDVPRLNSRNGIDVTRSSSKGSISSHTSGGGGSGNNSLSNSTHGNSNGAGNHNSLKREKTSPAPVDIFSIDRIVVETDIQKSLAEVAPSALQDFDLPPGLVTPAVARTVLELYVRGGYLSLKSVHKLLKLSYRFLKTRPNITTIDVSREDERVTVVGDIHGQLYDLLHIVMESGLPSKQVKYLFNGDFVDRGACGVECMCLLMALMLGFPGNTDILACVCWW